MDITQLSDTELKALAYDLIEQKEQTQLNLNTVNQEILNRRQAAANAPVDEVPANADEHPAEVPPAEA